MSKDFLTTDEKLQIAKEELKEALNMVAGITEQDLLLNVVADADTMEKAFGNGTNIGYRNTIKNELRTYINYLLED